MPSTQGQTGSNTLPRLAAAVGLAATALFASCGSDSAIEPTTTRPAATTTVRSNGATAPSSSASGVNASIPTDPSALPSCGDLPANALRTTPSKWWVESPSGLDLSYAFSTTRPESSGSTSKASTLVRIGEQDSVEALVALQGTPAAVSGISDEQSNDTVRDLPAVVGPEMSRGGPTTSTQANWSEAGWDYLGVGRGVDERELVSLLDQSTITDGLVTNAPPGWDLMGAGQGADGPNGTTIGFKETTGNLDDRGIAPIELHIIDTGSTLAGAALGADVDPAQSAVRVSNLKDRLVLIADNPNGTRSVYSTTDEGQAVVATGTISSALLLQLIDGLHTIKPSDPVLVGVPIGNSDSSGGACRDDL